jgi:transcriptional regulator with XRE-family HTH domain
LSQQALARDLAVVQQSLSRWESGIALPRDFRMNQIAQYFGEDSQTARVMSEIRQARKTKRRSMAGLSDEAAPPVKTALPGLIGTGQEQRLNNVLDDMGELIKYVNGLPQGADRNEASTLILETFAHLQQSQSNLRDVLALVKKHNT